MPDWDLDGPAEGGYADEIVRSVYLSSLFHFYEGRSAWHGSWSSTYYNRHSFHPAQEMVEERVEDMRTMGSRWSIVELPTIVFAGKTHALAAVEINTIRPFTNLSAESLHRPTLMGFAEFLLPLGLNSRWHFFLTAGRLLPARPPYSRWESYSVGGTYTLGWKRVRNAYRLDSARALIAGARRRLRRIASQTNSSANAD